MADKSNTFLAGYLTLLKRFFKKLLLSPKALLRGISFFFLIGDFFSSAPLSLAADLTSQLQVTVQATVPSAYTPPPSGGGGGGGGVFVPPQTVINFAGMAYPLSQVTVLKDAQVAASTIAGPDANFNVSLAGLSGGNYIFSIYGEDSKGRRSTLFTFPVSLTSGATTNVSGIFVTPTIDIDKTQVKKGDNLAIFGQTFPQSEVTIQVNSQEELFAKVLADKSGVYLYNLDTDPLEIGQHSTKSKTAKGGAVSSFSKVVGFAVGSKNVIKPEEQASSSDLNNDGKVNLVDFSVMAYWYKRPEPTAKADLNEDGKVDLKDFSILAFYWTG